MTPQRLPNPRRHGFSLTELMIVVSVIAVLAVIAAPSLRQFLVSSRLGSVANQFQADLQLARREAIKRNGPVLVCPGLAPTPTTSAWTCSTAYTTWATGWYVCSAVVASPAVQCSASTATDPNPIVSRNAVNDATSRMGDTGLALTGPAAAVQFNANGSATTAVTFTVSLGGKSYTGSVAATGHVAMAKPG